MRIQKLTTADELFESERVLATAFLHPWDEDEARKKAADQATGAAAVPEVTWGIYDDTDTLVCSISTLRHQFAFGGQAQRLMRAIASSRPPSTILLRPIT